MKENSQLPYITLSGEQAIPQIGLGLWQVKDAAVFSTVFTAAVAAGYRHFDTAQFYLNEAQLGEAWHDSGMAREDLFITTKVSVPNITLGKTVKSIADSLVNLQTEYVDLLLLHFPVPVQRKKAWLALEAAKKAGQTKNIGVSNYTIKHLEEMKTYASELPVVNQVELHVFLQQPELVAYCREHKIQLEAYSPLAHGRRMDDPIITGIAQKHGKSYAQVMLRWCVQMEFVVLPKSVTPQRIAQNIDLFDFRLDDDDMARLEALHTNLRTCWNPTHVP